MFCTNCGKEIGENVSFCQYCGKQVQENIYNTNEVDYSQINLQYSNLKKSKPIAYLLLLLAGTSGAHRFYTGNYVYCWVIFVFTLIWLFTKTPNPVPVLLLVDIFALNGAVESYNKDLLEKLEVAKKDNKFVDLPKQGCLPTIAYVIITGIIIWMSVIVNVLHAIGNS